tara:strand:- start:3655 stop:5970 length:2316 start_codon:yes stop_codon:yes gene_type:complete
MPKIPTFTAEGSITQLAGTTTTPQIGLNQTVAGALAPVTKMVVDQKIIETNAQNQAEALRLQNDYITDQIKITETINSDEIMSVNKDIANKYFKDQNNILINKIKSQATNSNVGIKFENYALAETRKTIFRNDKKISENILKNLFRGYDDQKQLLLITADTDDSGIAKGTLRTDLEKLTIDTFQSQVTYPELQIMLDNIPVELQTYDGLKDVQQAPRRTFYALKDKNYLPDISFEQRQKLEEKAMTLIRPQISTEWKNYIDTVAAGKEPPRFDMELAKEIMPEPIVRQMIAEDTFTKDRVANNAVLLNAPIGTTQEVAQAFIDEGYEMYTEAQANQNEQYIKGIVANKQKAIKNDPVKFLSSIDDDIQSLYNDLQNQEDTAAIQTKKELIDLLISKQRKMNFDETDIRVASNFEIQGMIESVTDPKTTALQKIQFIDQIQLMYGKENIGKIFNQLENQKLPREYMVAFSTNSVELKKDILSASSQNLQDLEDLVRKRMPSGKKFIDIEMGVAKGMKDFENVLSAQGESSEDMTKYVKSIQDTIYKSALFRMQNKKIPMDEAISSAVKEFTKDYYIPSSQTYFIPADVNGDETNRMIIEDKAEAILLEVEKGDYLDSFHGKDGYMHYAKFAGIENLSEEKVKDRIKSTIQNNSKWLLNSDSTGIILNAEYANGTYPIVNANGQKIEFFFVDTDNNKGILSTELKFPVTGNDIELIDYADPYGAYEYEETVIDENQNIDPNPVTGETVDTIGGDKPLKDPFALEDPFKNNNKK